jgi:hypothetical protein
MDAKFVIENKFNLKRRIEIIRVTMGRAYYMFIIVALAVICYNGYLIYSNQAVAGDDRKTLILIIIMVIWGCIPLVGGFIWDKLSEIKNQHISVYSDKLVIETNVGTRELKPDRFYGIYERESYIKFGPLKESIIINKKDVTQGDADELAKFLRDMP